MSRVTLTRRIRRVRPRSTGRLLIWAVTGTQLPESADLDPGRNTPSVAQGWQGVVLCHTSEPLCSPGEARFEPSAAYRLFDRPATFRYESSAHGQRLLISEAAPDADPASGIVANSMKP